MNVAHATTGNTEKRVFWKHHIEMQRTAGITQAEYCRKKGLKLHSFHYWKHVLKKEGEDLGPTKLVAIEPISNPSFLPGGFDRKARILLGEITLEIPLEMNAKILRQWVEALRGDDDVAR